MPVLGEPFGHLDGQAVQRDVVEVAVRREQRRRVLSRLAFAPIVATWTACIVELLASRIRAEEVGDAQKWQAIRAGAGSVKRIELRSTGLRDRHRTRTRCQGRCRRS